MATVDSHQGITRQLKGRMAKESHRYALNPPNIYPFNFFFFWLIAPRFYWIYLNCKIKITVPQSSKSMLWDTVGLSHPCKGNQDGDHSPQPGHMGSSALFQKHICCIFLHLKSSAHPQHVSKLSQWELGFSTGSVQVRPLFYGWQCCLCSTGSPVWTGSVKIFSSALS